MVSAVDRAFHVANHGVDPGEVFFGHAVGAAASDDADMVATVIENGGKTGEAVRVNQATRVKMSTGPALDFAGSETFDDVQVHGEGVVLFIHATAATKGVLFAESRPRFPPRCSPSQ